MLGSFMGTSLRSDRCMLAATSALRQWYSSPPSRMRHGGFLRMAEAEAAPRGPRRRPVVIDFHAHIANEEVNAATYGLLGDRPAAGERRRLGHSCDAGGALEADDRPADAACRHGRHGRRHPGHQPEHPAQLHLCARRPTKPTGWSGSATTTSPRRSRRSPTGWSASARCRCNRPSWRSRRWSARPASSASRASSSPRACTRPSSATRACGRSGGAPKRSACRSSSIPPAIPIRGCASTRC